MKLTLLLLGVGVVVAATGGRAHLEAVATAAGGQVVVVQAVPKVQADVAVDGKVVERQAGVGTMTDPVSLSAGSHDIQFSGLPGGTISTTVRVAPGSSSDVVLHLPASVDGAPVVNTYENPLSPIGPGKARILLAHTATVAPADALFDGKTVFSNIANGEFADADVPAGVAPRRTACPRARRAVRSSAHSLSTWPPGPQRWSTPWATPATARWTRSCTPCPSPVTAPLHPGR